MLSQNYIGNHTPIEYASLIKELNNQAPVEGFIFNEYCIGGIARRQYFSDANGKRIDAIRQKIEEWKSKKMVSQNQYYFLLASLLESADKVANTASVYGA